MKKFSKEQNSAFLKAEKIANGLKNGNEEKIGQEESVSDGKIERYKAKAADRRYKMRKKAELKEQRKFIKEEKERLKKERKKSGAKGFRGGYVTAIVALGLSTLTLATVLTVGAMVPTATDSALENDYRRSFYNVVEQVNNMDIDLSKALATKSTGAVQSYLMDIAVNSELAENNIQQLPLEDQSKFYTAKVINQVGDYAKYLNKKIINGESVTEKDHENLKELYKANNALKNAMQSAIKSMENGYEFSKMSKNYDGNDLLKEFDELQELSADYPELIYDGPFSDGKDEENGNTYLSLGEEVSEEKAVDTVKELLSEYGVKNVKCVGKTNGNIQCYAIEGTIKGFSAYANVTVRGGKLLMYSYVGSCNGVNYEESEAKDEAQKFLEKAGYGELKAVWINLDNNLYTINFAPEINGIIMYPDLIKVRVCAETNMVIGVEATGFCKNHKDRILPPPSFGKSQAREEVSDEIAVESARLAVTPYGKSERLCYEFCGTKDGEIYYIYIDAENGRQVEMFKVIDSEQGKLLM